MTVRRLARLAIAVPVAALVPAVLLGIMARSSAVLPSAFVITLGLAILLGLPLFLAFKKWGWASAATAALAGFMIGGVLGGILGWPIASSDTDYSSYFTSDRITHDRPVMRAPLMDFEPPALDRWTSYLEFLALFGILGAAGGLAFWYVAEASPTSDDPHNNNTSGA